MGDDEGWRKLLSQKFETRRGICLRNVARPDLTDEWKWIEKKKKQRQRTTKKKGVEIEQVESGWKHNEKTRQVETSRDDEVRHDKAESNERINEWKWFKLNES